MNGEEYSMSAIVMGKANEKMLEKKLERRPRKGIIDGIVASGGET